MSGRTVLQRAGAMEEKALFLNPTRQNSLTDRIYTYPPATPDGQDDTTGMRCPMA